MTENPSNKNAFKHGAYVADILLPGENEEEFNALKTELIEEWDPKGPSEIDKVFNVTRNMWRKRRFQQHQRNKIAIPKKDKIRRRRFMDREIDDLIGVLEFIENADPKSITKEELLNKLTPWRAKMIQKHIGEYPNIEDWVAEMAELIEIVIDESSSVQHQLDKQHALESDETVAESDLAFEERLDAKIEKDLLALGKIKTMKSIGIGSQRHRSNKLTD